MNTFEQRRQVTYYRAAFHDMPVAGPMDGAAYGEYLKSKGLGMIIGVVASVVTMGAAMPLLASTVLATQIAGGVMMAGGVMSGVGAVTGNKKLMKIGGIMSLAGGIGAAASGLTGGLGLGGAGSGSEAVSNMANSFMDSASNVSGGLLYGDRVAGEAAATAAEDFASNAAEQEAGTISAAGQETGASGEILASTATEELPVQLTGAAEPAGVQPTGDSAVQQAVNDARGATVSDAGQIDLAGGERAGASAGGKIPEGGGTPGPAPSADQFTVPQYGANKPAATDTLFGMNKTELMKTGAGLLEKAAAAAFSPDQQAQQDALIAQYGAQAARYNSATEVEQYKLANAKKQVVMISANDPQMEQKVAAAAAAGHPVAFIPSVAAAGVTPTAGGAQMAAPRAQQVAAQAPVRQGTFA